MFKILFDENLRDYPENPKDAEEIVEDLEAQLKNLGTSATRPLDRVKLLCDLGTGHRLLGHLDRAKDLLKEAIDICETFSLDIKTLTRAQIILAHILQWQGNFLKSNRLFGELIISCESDIGLGSMKSFIYQHAGKNLFDQKMYPQALKFFEKALAIRRAENSAADLIESSLLAIETTRLKMQNMNR